LIQPDGSEGFQVNAGLRIRGGFSRQDDNPKHSFRVLFRGEYGDSELNYPLHGEDGADTFDRLDFRTAQNYSKVRPANCTPVALGYISISMASTLGYFKPKSASMQTLEFLTLVVKSMTSMSSE